MKAFRSSAVFFCSLLVVTAILFPRQSLSLSLVEMQATAIDTREVVKRYMVNVEKGARDIGRARSGYLPAVDLLYRVNSLDERSLTEDKENSLIYGAVRWNLFNGFRDMATIQSAELQKEIEAIRLNGLRQDLSLNVALRYLDVYERLANVEVAEKNFTTLSKVYADSQNRLEVGLIDRNELLKFKVDLDNSDILLKEARAGLEKSLHLLGRETGTQLQLADLDFAEFVNMPVVEDAEENREKMLVRRSELLALNTLIEVSRFQVKAEESGYYPRVNLVGSYSKYDNDYFNGRGSINEEELRAQLELSLNLFSGRLTEESVARAKLEIRGLQYDLEELKNTLTTELINLYIDYDVSLKNVDVALRGIEQAEENLRITELKYNEGLERQSDLLDAIASLSRAQYNYVAVVRTVFLNYFSILRMVEGFLIEV